MKRIGFWLLFILSLAALTLWAGATAPAGQANMSESWGPVTEPDPQTEIVGWRTTNSKHFDLGDGRYRAQISSAPIHYVDEGGQWREIDTTLLPYAVGGYAVESNGLQAYLPERSGGAVRVSGRIYPQAPPGAEGRNQPLAAVWMEWQPLIWRYSGPAGRVGAQMAIRAVSGQAQGDTITYPGALPQVDESYQVIPNGLKHLVTLRQPPPAPPGTLSGDTNLEYVGQVWLPEEACLYAEGRLQEGDFSTQGAIEIRDASGRTLLTLRAPVAYEIADPVTRIKGSYAVQRQGDELLLTWRTPAAWLLAPERHYPVALDPTVDLGPAGVDTMISPVLADPQGSQTYIWAGYIPASFAAIRALMAWGDLSAIPPHALLEGGSSFDGQLRLRMIDRSGDDLTRYLSLHKVTNWWSTDHATWTQRTQYENWDAPGGDYVGDYLTSVSVDTNLGYKYWRSLKIRDLVAVWRTFIVVEPIYTYGEYPYGLLLRDQGETSDEIKIFASREYTGDENYKPILFVDYQLGPQALSDQTPVWRRVPSPDYYSTPAINYMARVVAMRAEEASKNYDLRLYDTDSYLTSQRASTQPAGKVDFIAIAPALTGAYYPMVYTPNANTGYYYIEYLQRIAYLGVLDSGGSFGPYSMSANSVARLWTFSATAGDPICAMADPISGSGRLGIALIEPGDAGQYFFARSDALAEAYTDTGGSTVAVNSLAPKTGTYSLVVWKRDSTYDSEFYLRGCNSVFLPLIAK